MGTMAVNPDLVVTPRQLELIALYASGYAIERIASVKFLSYSSVKQTLATARARTGAKSLTHLCVICLDAGLIAQNGNGYTPVQIDGVVSE